MAAATTPGRSMRESSRADVESTAADAGSGRSVHCAAPIAIAAMPRIQSVSSGVPAVNVSCTVPGR